MTHRVGSDRPYTLANLRANTIMYLDNDGIPRGMLIKQPTRIQQITLDAHGKQITRQNNAIEQYMRHLTKIPLSSLKKEIQRRHDRNALRVATGRYPFPGCQDTDDIIRSFLMGKPKKSIKAGKNKVGKPKKPIKAGKNKVGKPKKSNKVGKNKIGKPKKSTKVGKTKLEKLRKMKK